MSKTYVQLIGPIAYFDQWEKNFNNMEKIIKKAFEEQGYEVVVINPKIFSSPQIKEPLLLRFKEIEKEIIRLLDLPVIYEPQEPSEAFWFTISFTTIVACDWVFISKLSYNLSVGSAIETLWASKHNIRPLFEVHISPEELERAFKNAAFMAEMNEEDVYVLIESQTMTLTFANEKDYQEKQKNPMVKFFEVLKIEHKQSPEEQKKLLKGIIEKYKTKGYWLLLPKEGSDSKIGFVLTFYSLDELSKPS